jgi:hypothetical protein
LDRAQKILPHAMLPFVLPPSELIQMLNDKFRKNEGVTDDEEKALLEKKEQSIYVIKVLVSLLKNKGQVPAIPPAELADILINLIEENSTSIQRMSQEKRLKLIKETIDTLSLKDLKRYSNQSPEYKKSLAKLFVAAIQKPSKDTLAILQSVGFDNKDLTDLIQAFYEDHSNKEKQKFINSLLKIFEEETVVINQFVSDRFLNIGDEEQKKIIKNNNYKGQIERLIANLRDVKPELCSSSQRELKYTYVKSFLMPGYPKTFYESDAGLRWGMWNYSNYALLGAALGAEMLFIGSDYEEKDYYWTGVYGTYIFALNGLAGLIHAYFYDPPIAKKSTKADVGFSISKNQMVAICRIKF